MSAAAAAAAGPCPRAERGQDEVPEIPDGAADGHRRHPVQPRQPPAAQEEAVVRTRGWGARGQGRWGCPWRADRDRGAGGLEGQGRSARIGTGAREQGGGSGPGSDGARGAGGAAIAQHPGRAPRSCGRLRERAGRERLGPRAPHPGLARALLLGAGECWLAIARSRRALPQTRDIALQSIGPFLSVRLLLFPPNAPADGLTVKEEPFPR